MNIKDIRKIKFPKNRWARIGIWAGIVIVLTPLWLGPLAKCIANLVVPGIVGVEFHIGSLWINPWTGGLSVGDLRLGNPEGYDKKDAVNLRSLSVDVSMLSLVTSCISVEDIDLNGLDIYVSAGGGNFAKIGENASGGKTHEEEQQEISEKQAKADGVATESDGKSGKKVEIDRLHVAGLTLQYGIVPVPVPELTLTDLGKASDGASFADMWEQIKSSVLASAGAVGGKFKELGSGAVDAGKNAAGKAGEAIGNAAGAIKSLFK